MPQTQSVQKFYPSSAQEIERVQKYGTPEKLLSLFNPDTKHLAVGHQMEMFRRGRTPKLRDVANVHGENIALAFLQIHLSHSFDMIGISLGSADMAVKIANNLAQAMLREFMNIMLSEWLLFFHHLENNSDLPSEFSQPKFMRFVRSWVEYRNTQREKIERIDRQAQQLEDDKNSITYEEYLKNHKS